MRSFVFNYSRWQFASSILWVIDKRRICWEQQSSSTIIIHHKKWRTLIFFHLLKSTVEGFTELAVAWILVREMLLTCFQVAVLNSVHSWIRLIHQSLEDTLVLDGFWWQHYFDEFLRWNSMKLQVPCESFHYATEFYFGIGFGRHFLLHLLKFETFNDQNTVFWQNFKVKRHFGNFLNMFNFKVNLPCASPTSALRRIYVLPVFQGSCT